MVNTKQLERLVYLIDSSFTCTQTSKQQGTCLVILWIECSLDVVI